MLKCKETKTEKSKWLDIGKKIAHVPCKGCFVRGKSPGPKIDFFCAWVAYLLGLLPYVNGFEKK